LFFLHSHAQTHSDPFLTFTLPLVVILPSPTFARPSLVMEQEHIERWVGLIASELSQEVRNVKAVAELLAEGATIPFIARYRKERTGSMDEVGIANIRERIDQLRELDKRRESIISSIEKQGKFTPELMQAIVAAGSLAELEDIYLPYKPRRRTRASMAREKGLEPLAQEILQQKGSDPVAYAQSFVSEEKGVASTEEALEGARDIIAEWVSEDQETRKRIRDLFRKEGVIESRVLKGKEGEGQKYKDYFDWKEQIAKVPSHRLLAMRRGEKEGILSLDIFPPEESAIASIEK